MAKQSQSGSPEHDGSGLQPLTAAQKAIVMQAAIALVVAGMSEGRMTVSPPFATKIAAITLGIVDAESTTEEYHVGRGNRERAFNEIAAIIDRLADAQERREQDRLKAELEGAKALLATAPVQQP